MSIISNDKNSSIEGPIWKDVVKDVAEIVGYVFLGVVAAVAVAAIYRPDGRGPSTPTSTPTGLSGLTNKQNGKKGGKINTLRDLCRW
ncbi:MAG: hypothetical protein AMS24_01870 [Chlamydiae bacterium SM23_39]|nr:MAG: hypothetical protein AMS24_01870 [Chlamydiae bacterium SM23_39]